EPVSFQAEDGIRDFHVTGVQTCALPICEGSYVFTTDNSPGTVTATMQGNGLQGVLFGVKYHTIGLSLTKTHVGEFKAGGTGTYKIGRASRREGGEGVGGNGEAQGQQSAA